jgi:hypothetical protein
MDINQFLGLIANIAIGFSITAVLLAICAVVAYYSFKWAANLILKRDKHVAKLKKSRLFDAYRDKSSPGVRMVKGEREKIVAKGKG